jgi:DNA-binding MarR family transcriptional regulator
MEPSSALRTAQPSGSKVSRADRELGYRLGAVMLQCMSADGGSAIRVIDDSGLTFTQMKVLMTLAGAREEAPSLKPIAEGLGVSLPSASRAVEGLVKRALVTRTEDPSDRRQRLLALTEGGQELADRIMAARLEGLGQFAAALTDEQRERLSEALELLLEREEIADVYRQYRRQADR